MQSLLQDLRDAVRSLRRAPAFTLAAVLTLALGTGAVAAIFSIFDQALLRPLPVPFPDRMVNLSSPGLKTGRTSTSGTARASDVFSYPLFRDIERAQTVFTGVAAHRDFKANVAYQGRASSEDGRLVSGDYFRVLELRPAAGRLLAPADDRPGANNVAVLSYRYWISRFGGEAQAINANIVVNGQSMTVVGVTPSTYAGTSLEDSPKVYVPLTLASQMIPGWSGFEDRRDHWLYLFARLKPGVERESAEEAMSGPFAAILRDIDFPAQLTGIGADKREEFIHRRLFVEPGKQGQRPEREELRGVFRLLFCVTGVVLLIACANVAGLLLARGASRAADLSVRMSLGASRRKLISQMLVESCLLAGIGTICGLVLAVWILRAFGSTFPQQAGGYFRFQIDPVLFLFAAGITSAIVLLIGVYPAVQATRGDLTVALKGTRTSSGTRSASRFRTSLAIAQIALSIGLLAVAGLFSKSLINVSRLELGIVSDHLATFRLSPELNGHTPEQARVIVDRVEQELRSLPGFQSASVSTIALLAGEAGGSNITLDAFGTRIASDRGVMRADVGPDYFKTVGIPLVAGREFSASDEPGAPRVAVVNEAFAKKYVSGRNPVGLLMAEGAGDKIQLNIQIVGVARDARYSQIKDAPPPQYFMAYRQRRRPGAPNFYVRSSQPADQMASMIPAAVRRVDETLPVENLRTMNDQLMSTQHLDRFMRTLSVGFAGLALLLAAIGLYGVLSFTVIQRRSEFGVRMALGADAPRIGRLVVARLGRMIVIGGVAGVLAAFELSQLARSQLFGVEGIEPIVLIGAVLCTSLVAIAAGAIPAWRATRVDPVTALRTE